MRKPLEADGTVRGWADVPYVPSHVAEQGDTPPVAVSGDPGM